MRKQGQSPLHKEPGITAIYSSFTVVLGLFACTDDAIVPYDSKAGAEGGIESVRKNGQCETIRRAALQL